MMKLLVVGGGGREHALVWKLASESGVSAMVCVPGNPGIAEQARTVPAAATDPAGLLALARAENADLTIVGPEKPLSRGIADLFTQHGLAICGPTRAAAEIESSKAFAKAFMSRHNVPTARYHVCDSPGAALDVVRRGEFSFPVVLKADGLAAGKGVIIASDRESAESTIRALMVERSLGEAGSRLVVEECLVGDECSFFVLSDGRRALPIGTAQDYKRAFDDDRGPNTGGMGALAPSPLIDEALAARIMSEVVGPTIEGLRAEGREYRGFLYVGLMLTADGPQVLEFNARLGDPETQVLLPLLADDLVPLLANAASGRLYQTSCRVRDETAVGVVLASGGYPDGFETGKPIVGLHDAARVPDVVVFHAGTAQRGGTVVTAGGRVLTVVGKGADYELATNRAYEAAGRIAFDGIQLRCDIGRKVVTCLQSRSSS